MSIKTKSVTIHNVAKVAGVSISTVSRVVNKLGRVAPDTRRKVESAIQELDFHPNMRAQALSKKCTDTIGLVVPDFEGQYFSMLMEGANEEAERNGVHLMVLKAKGSESKVEAIIRLCSGGRTDGLILMLDELWDNVLDVVGNVDSPLVILDKDVNYKRLDNILVDNRMGAFEAAKHLIDVHNAKELFFIGGPENNVDTTDRAKGFSDALALAGLNAKGRQYYGRTYSYDEGYKLTKDRIARIIDSGRQTGIVAANDDIACGVIDALEDMDIKVPDQVGVIGFDDSYIAIRRRLKLSSMRIPMKEIGSAAVKMVLNRIEDRELEPSKVILKARLIVRESCGCNRKSH